MIFGELKEKRGNGDLRTRTGERAWLLGWSGRQW